MIDGTWIAWRRVTARVAVSMTEAEYARWRRDKAPINR